MNKSVLSVFLAAALISGLVVVSAVPVSSAQQGLVVIIGYDATWTKTNSPVNLTGPTMVNADVTLTINAGVTVYQNGYSLYVNGTLRAIGSASDKIQISGGEITLAGNNQTGSTSTFENAVVNSTISSSKPLTLNNNIINRGITVGATSSLANNIITGAIDAGDSTTFSNNNINGDINTGGFSIFQQHYCRRRLCRWLCQNYKQHHKW